MKLFFQTTLILVVIFTSITSVHEVHLPVFRVVLDPGHGGQALFPQSMHGDRYDTLSGTYLQMFREGATFRSFVEHRENYSLALKVFSILKDAAPGGNFPRFKKLLDRFGVPAGPRVHLVPFISRNDGISRHEAVKQKDPNASYRLYDFPDETGNIQPGRFSQINRLKPHLVLSIHAATSAPADYTAINPVLVPPWSMLEKGRKYLRGELTSKKFFYQTPNKHWFREDVKRSPFKWFLSDTSQYFTGYPLKKDGSTDEDTFRGYRYNMVSWKYRDAEGWEEHAARHEKETRYSKNIRNMEPAGPFFERERSIYEKYRREKGPEGFGGDNAYASYEISRFILQSLQKEPSYRLKHRPGKPYVCIWALPLHVNAVCAFLELGYFIRYADRPLFRKYRDEVAQGTAVGIYSLFVGIESRDKKMKYLPRGKSIDFSKYIMPDSTSYFETVME